MSLIPFEILRGKSFDLIPLDMSRLDEMWEYSRDERLYEHFEFGVHESIEQTKEYLTGLIARTMDDKSRRWFIELSDNRKVIGSFSLHDIDTRRDSCEISYAVSPQYWGTGIFSEVLHLVMDHLFNELKFHRLVATTSLNNYRSIGALKKNGFVVEGKLRDFYKDKSGLRIDALVLSILRDDFQNETA